LYKAVLFSELYLRMVYLIFPCKAVPIRQKITLLLLFACQVICFRGTETERYKSDLFQYVFYKDYTITSVGRPNHAPTYEIMDSEL
jgi:hypothetical protein